MTTINLDTLIKLVEVPDILDDETIVQKLKQIDMAMVELQQAKQHLIDSDPEYAAYLERYQKFASAPPLTLANYYTHKTEYALLIDGLETMTAADIDRSERKLFYLRHRLAY
jgi:hypothetical protein